MLILEGHPAFSRLNTKRQVDLTVDSAFEILKFDSHTPSWRHREYRSPVSIDQIESPFGRGGSNMTLGRLELKYVVSYDLRPCAPDGDGPLHRRWRVVISKT